MSTSDLVPTESNPTERVESDDELEIGQWYWVKQYGQDYIEDSDDEEDDTMGPVYEKLPWLVCIVRIGSNHAKVRGVGGATQRIHRKACARGDQPRLLAG